LNGEDQTERQRLSLLEEKLKTLSNEELTALADLLRRQGGDMTEELKIVAQQIARNHALRIKLRHPL
jgi:hypothetical protein